jgi:hypothetical protein
MKPLHDGSRTLDLVSVTELASGMQVTGTANGYGAGTHSGGASLPGSAAMLVNYRIAQRYRGGKPRTYWPFATTVDMANAQTWNLAGATNWPNVMAALYSGILAATGGGYALTQQTSISYYGGTPPLLAQHKNGETLWTSQRRAAPVLFDVLGFSIATKIASQRRRLKAH